MNDAFKRKPARQATKVSPDPNHLEAKAFDKIAAGLAEAIDFAQGKKTGARVHHVEMRVEMRAVDVATIRASTGLSQAAFARSIGVAKGTLLNWEHGRRQPTGPAQVLLAMIAKRPSLVGEFLR